MAHRAITETGEVEFRARANFFGNGAEESSVLVDVSEYPRVRVWDGRMFTVRHHLSDRSVKRFINQARAAVSR